MEKFITIFRDKHTRQICVYCKNISVEELKTEVDRWKNNEPNEPKINQTITSVE